MGQHQVKLYQGTEIECSYLDDLKATNIYADPHHPDPDHVYNQLIVRGFRRSGEYIYRPGCNACDACVPLRLINAEFRTRRTDRRTLRDNADLRMHVQTAAYTDEYFNLYKRYLAHRHPGGGMDDPNPQDFERFLLKPWGKTLFIELRQKNRCVAVAVTDVTTTGLSAVYTFFEPELHKRALGRFAILKQIELSASMRLPYLYLGYWVRNCRKMAYKVDFHPHEQFVNQQWKRVEQKSVETGGSAASEPAAGSNAARYQ